MGWSVRHIRNVVWARRKTKRNKSPEHLFGWGIGYLLGVATCPWLLMRRGGDLWIKSPEQSKLLSPRFGLGLILWQVELHARSILFFASVMIFVSWGKISNQVRVIFTFAVWIIYRLSKLLTLATQFFLMQTLQLWDNIFLMHKLATGNEGSKV